MALLFRGLTTCPICGEVIDEHDLVVMFPHFVANENDPLYRFTDGVFHERCFDRDPDGARALAILDETNRRLGPGHRTCAVCSGTISDLDDYFAIGYLTSDAGRPAFAFNYVQLHRSHIGSWSELRPAIAALEDFERSGDWEGPGLAQVIDELRAYE
jgi:hypothetical protein